MTEDQTFCVDALAEIVGGHHHLPQVHEFGTGICVNWGGNLATYDGSLLTRLVLMAHRRAIRIEITASGPGMVRIIAHRRKPMAPAMRYWERHPTIEDLLSAKGESE